MALRNPAYKTPADIAVPGAVPGVLDPQAPTTTTPTSAFATDTGYTQPPPSTFAPQPFTPPPGPSVVPGPEGGYSQPTDTGGGFAPQSATLPGADAPVTWTNSQTGQVVQGTAGSPPTRMTGWSSKPSAVQPATIDPANPTGSAPTFDFPTATPGGDMMAQYQAGRTDGSIPDPRQEYINQQNAARPSATPLTGDALAQYQANQARIKDTGLVHGPGNPLTPGPVGPGGQPPRGDGRGIPQPGGPASFGQIDPVRNMIGQSITPGSDPRVNAAQGQTDYASNFTQNALGRLEGPDRGQIAQDVLRQLRESSQDSFDQGVRGIGQDASRFGRLGSGVTTTRLGDLASNRETDLTRASQALASEAAGQTLNDRMGIFNAGTNATDLFGGLQNQTFGQGQDTRNEYRGERGYQNNLNQQALDNRVRQLTLSDDLLNSSFNRDSRRLDQIGGNAFGGSPTGALLDASAGRAGQAADSGSAVAEILRQYALSRGQN